MFAWHWSECRGDVVHCGNCRWSSRSNAEVLYYCGFQHLEIVENRRTRTSRVLIEDTDARCLSHCQGVVSRSKTVLIAFSNSTWCRFIISVSVRNNLFWLAATHNLYSITVFKAKAQNTCWIYCGEWVQTFGWWHTNGHLIKIKWLRVCVCVMTVPECLCYLIRWRLTEN